MKIEEQIKALARVGFRGYVSLETHFKITKPIEGHLWNLLKGDRFPKGSYETRRIGPLNRRKIEEGCGKG